jgi:hypothetical protein
MDVFGPDMPFRRDITSNGRDSRTMPECSDDRSSHAAAAVLRVVSMVLLVSCLSAPSLAQPAPRHLADRPLEDALRVLQARGLRLVFTSEIVTPEMRVGAEPRGRTAREQLDQILAPHGLRADDGPGHVLRIVRARRPPATGPKIVAAPRNTADVDASAAAGLPGPAAHVEMVEVVADRREGGSGHLGSARGLDSRHLQDLAGRVADDPLRTVHSLPGVAAGDDFRSEFSVRGSPYRHAGLIVDGVVAPWLQHASPGRGNVGTVTMIPGDAVQEAVLLMGAYPRRDGAQIGPQLSLTLREGSRTAAGVRLAVSGTSTSLTAEGPIGELNRGSWLVGARKSHVEWPVGRNDHDRTVFGYGDLQSKIVYDVTPRQQVSVSLVAGLSNVEREDLGPQAMADGVNRAAVVSLSWRSTLGSHTVVTQRVSGLTHAFVNRFQSARPASAGDNRAYAYRGELERPLGRGLLEIGTHVRHVGGSRRGVSWLPFGPGAAPTTLPDVDASWMERSGHLSFQQRFGSTVTMAAGLRVADSSLADGDASDRWLQAEWSVRPEWRLHASAGVTHQFPALDDMRGRTIADRLRPEQATHLDVGIAHRLSDRVRWDATLFGRRERDVLRQPDAAPRLLDGALAEDDLTRRLENALAGTARGIELSIERRDDRFSGWIGYAYGIARSTDVAEGETFAADFDQRHALNASGTARLPWASRLTTTFRAGTNFPIPGYVVARDGRLVVTDRRNLARLPAYTRLDLRADRAFGHAERRLTLFVEVLNVLNRSNLGLADGAIRRDTGEAVGFTERLYPRLLTAGVRFEF